MPVGLEVGAGPDTGVGAEKNGVGAEKEMDARGAAVGFSVGVVVGRNVTGDVGVVGEAVPKNLNNK